MHTVYIEKEIIDHRRVKSILQKLKPQHVILCDHYKEVFNPRGQNFRVQKKDPCLILAKKQGNRICSTPESFGIGGSKNYYFSHMLNCLYDCRYCFLQGMYSSANYVVFVNYEDFKHDIAEICSQATEPVYFFSGYDGDSLAYEPITQFVKEFLPFFCKMNNAILELRTKSTNVKELLSYPAYPHCVVAFSFTPQEISSMVEHKVPQVTKRIEAMVAVAEHGWPVGLRFDPLIYHPNFKEIYQDLIANIFLKLPQSALHSVSIGPMRFPDKMYQKIVSLYPNDPLLAHPLYRQGKIFSYKREIETTMKNYVLQCLKPHVDNSILFECHV